MAEKPTKPCKRRKSDTLEAAVSAGLALLEAGESGKAKKQRKPAHFRIVKSGIIRQTHTPYRPRAKVRADDLEQTCTGEHNLIDESDVDSGPQMSEDIDVDEEMESIISQCNELLESQPRNQRTHKTWSHRMADLQSSWEEGRSKIFEILVVGECLPKGLLCSVCCLNPATIRCHQCGHCHILCHECDRSCHATKPFHDREAWFENHFEPIQPSLTVDENGQVFDADCFISFSPKVQTCFQCGHHNSFHAIPSKDTAVVFTIQGRFDVSSSIFICNNCSCMSPLTLEDVLYNGYWPASPTSLTTLFSQDLFLTWDTFQKRMPGCSEASFVRSLEDVSVTKGRIGTINPRTFTKAFREWKYCKYELDVLQSKDWLICPCCSLNQHSCHVDGNMKLYRYKRSGSKKDESYYGDVFVASNADVDRHLEKVYEHPNVRGFFDDGKCGETNWRAAGNKSKRYRHLDETGLEIAGCRHGLAQWAVNMFRGEIYGYANYIHIHKMTPNNVTYMWEDIICKYWKWAKNIPGNCIEQENMKPALSVMHAKAHNWSCQILWGGRWQEGAACSTGEEVEQINSYLSRISNTTKYMLPEYREELITEHAIAWNKRKIISLAEALFKRYGKTLKGLESAKKELDDALTTITLQKESVNAVEWKKDVQIVARELESRSISKVADEEEFYLLCSKTSVVADLLPNLAVDRSAERDYVENYLKKVLAKYATAEDKQRRQDTLSGKLCVEMSFSEVMKKGQRLCLQRALETVRNELELLSFSIYQRKICIDKLAASSKVRTKLRKKLSADQAQISRRTHLHNQIQLALGIENVQPLSQSSIVDGLFPWTLNDISVRLKCKVVDKFEIVNRHEEEVDLIKKEIIHYLKYYKDMIPQLKSQVKSLEAYLVQEVSTSHLESSMLLVEANVKKTKYAVADNRSKTVIMGEISIRWKGVQFAKQQLKTGLETFSNINDCDFDVPLEDDYDEEHISDDDSRYDVDDEYIEQLTEDQGHDIVVNWNESE